MRHLILAILAGAATVMAQPTATAITGQGLLTESVVGWGSNNSRSLYIAGTSGYLRDSASMRVAVDTAASSVGGAGACSQTIVIRTGSAVTPQLRCELSYHVRATDPNEDGFNIYIATRYRTPAGTDTNWVLPGRQYLWDSSQVYLTHTDPGADVAGSTRLVNFYLSGQDARVCVQRAATGGPGAGDTIAIGGASTPVFLRCW